MEDSCSCLLEKSIAATLLLLHSYLLMRTVAGISVRCIQCVFALSISLIIILMLLLVTYKQFYIYICVSVVLALFFTCERYSVVSHHKRSLCIQNIYCIRILIFSFMLYIARLGVRCIYQCVLVYTMSFAYVAFALSISLILILMLLLVYL